MKKIMIFAIICALVISLAACGGQNVESSSPEESTANTASSERSETPGTSAEVSKTHEEISDQQSGAEPVSEEEAEEDEYFTKFDRTASYDADDTTIVFEGGSVRIEGIGVSANGAIVTITAPGTYVVSGSSSNGQIIVSVTKEDKVRIVLKGLDLTCTNSAPVWVKSADKVAITLADGTVNNLTDGKNYVYDNTKNEPNACIFSKDDLTINGNGTLNVTANNNNGIGSKNDLRIVSGVININAAKNAVKGNDSVSIKDATLNITNSKDGIKCDNAEEAEKGYIYIRSGNITINASDDAIQATLKVVIEGGKVTVNAKKSINCEGTVNVADGVLVEK